MTPPVQPIQWPDLFCQRKSESEDSGLDAPGERGTNAIPAFRNLMRNAGSNNQCKSVCVRQYLPERERTGN